MVWGSSPGSDPFAPICATAGALASYNQAAAQLAICSGPLTGFAGNAVVSDCKTNELAGMICGATDSAPGTNPWAYICGQSTAIIDGFTQATAQDRACLAKGATDAGTGNNCAFRTAVLSACDLNPYEVATDTNADLCAASTSTTNGETYLVRRGICEDKTTTFTETYCGPNDKAVGGTDTAVKDVRDEICLEQEAGDINSGDNNCIGRANVNAACLPADPFLHVGCSSADNIAGTRITYCTTGDKVFDTECNNAAYAAAGARDQARGKICREGRTVVPAATGCGDELVQGGFAYTYCRSTAGLGDSDLCSATRAAVLSTACTTNPWATGCVAANYYSRRLELCVAGGASVPTDAPADACRDLAKRTCDIGGEGATVNPFHETCYGGADDYTPDRLARCEVDAVETITGLGGTCSGAGLSDVICGSSASESGTNPFAPICDSDTQNANFANLDRAKQLSCGATRLGAGATNKGVCDTLQDGLCTGANSVSATPQGAGNFVCSTDSEPNVVLARNNFCQDPATTYATGCTTAIGTTLNTRRTLATSCVEGGSNFPQSGTADAVCNQEVAAGLTVAACSANPYLDACEVVGVKEAFTTVTTARDNLCTTSVANSDPFNALCGVFPTRNVQLVDYCDEPTTAWEGRCVGGGLLDTGNAIANARANVCINNLAIITTADSAPLVAANNSLFSSRCTGLSLSGGGTTVTATRLPLCAGALNLLSAAGGNATLCNSAELSGVICGTLGDTTASNVYAPICSDQLALTSGYTVADVNARRTDTCLDTPVAGRDPSCGSETPNSGYIGTYCAGDNNSAAADNAKDCPNTAYLRKNPTVTTALTASALGGTGANSALNSDGTARLTGENVFLTAQLNAGDTDAATNFANIGAATFEKGDVNELISLKLDAVGGNSATTSGFLGGISPNNSDKLYVGILSNTNVGAPLTSNPATAAWPTIARVINGTTALDASRQFILDVSFSNKTITTRTTSRNASDDLDLPPDFGSLGTIGINGSFTANGVIYGTVDFGGTNTGTLTGLIGQVGAVGIFKSAPTSSTVPNPNPYVGGFVSDNPNTAPLLNCGENEENGVAPTPFDDDCDGVNDDLQVRLCVEKHALASAGSGQAVNCTMNNTFTSAVCITSGRDADPFDTLCPDDAGKKKTFVNLCADTGNLGALGGSTACEGDINTCLASPFASGCTGPEYADVRTTAIGTCRSDMTPFDAKCAEYGDRGNQQTTFCTTRAGVGDADCNTGGYITTLCGAGDGTNVFATVCTDANRITFCTTGTTNIFDSRCNTSTSEVMQQANMAREAACAESAVNAARAMDAQCTATVLRICGTEGKVFNSACLRANISMTYHPARLLACAGDAALPANDSCNSPILAGVICGTSASDTGTDPFAPICSISTQNSNFANLAAVQDLQCRTKATPADAAVAGDDCYELAYGTNGFCDGNAAGDNPYAPVCGENNGVNQASFCTSFNQAGNTEAIQLCNNDIAVVCPNTPFRSDGTVECLSNSAYANQRAEQCSKGTQGTGDCNTETIANTVCASTGPYANPFADFCSTTTARTTGMTLAEIRQGVYTTCLDGTKDSDSDVCESTASDRTKLSTITCIATNPNALFGAECDYTEFKVVEVNYCTVEGNVWLTTCNSENVADINSRISDARATICIENREIITGGADGVADRMSLFNSACNGLAHSTNGLTVALARIALAEMCRTNDMADGCDQPADGLNGKSVADCSANPYDTTDTLSCAGNDAFNAERTARNNLCTSSTSGSDPFNALCDVFAARMAERTAHCGTSKTNPWDAKCEGALVTAGDATIAEARTNVCLANTEIRTGSETVTQALFNSRCAGRANQAGDTVTTARLGYCEGAIADLNTAGGTPALCKDTELSGAICGMGSTPGSNPFAPICTESTGAALLDGFNLAEAQEAVCLVTGTSNLPGETCGAIVSGVCGENPFTQTTQTGGQTDLCVDASGSTTYAEGRERACGTAGTSSLPNSDCQSVKNRLCTGAGSIETMAGAGMYNCSVDGDFSNDRETQCGTGDPAGGSVCETVITGLCMGAGSILKMAGQAGYNCSDDEAFSNDREVECGTNDPAADSVCETVVTGLCTGANSFEIAVGAGNYNCSDDAAFVGVRLTECALIGAHSTCETLITTNCTNVQSGSPHANCPATPTGNADVALWQGGARNSGNTGYLTDVVASDRASEDDADANFIVGGAAGLSLGSEVSNTITPPAPLTLNGVEGITGTDDGFALASATFDAGSGNVTKLYVGLLSTTALGAPLDNADQGGDWTAKTTVLTSTGATVNGDFKLTVNYSMNSLAVKDTTTLTLGALGVISINGQFTANGVIFGTVDFAGANAGTLTGLIGQDGAVGIFASNAGASTAYVGGFVAAPEKEGETGTTVCDTTTPFTDANCDPVVDATARLAEANRCYNDGGAVQTGGDCGTISACLARNASGLFGTRTLDNGVTCSDVAFAGARANFCSAGVNGNGGNIVAPLCRDFIALNNAEAACLTDPFTSDCEAKLGTAITTTSRDNRINYCTSVGRSDSTNTNDGNPCAGALVYCSTQDRATCASSVPGTNSDLITAFCGVFRNLSDAVCTDTMERTISCNGNPFYTFCTEADYITAQRTACGSDNYSDDLRAFEDVRVQIQGADGRSNTVIDAAYCSTLNHTATLCAESGQYANPFALICDTDTNTNRGNLATTQQNFCRADGILEANLSDCGGVASAFCATAGTDNAVAFDNLCRDASYDEARVKACGAGTPNTSTYTANGFTDCNTLVANLCPGNPGCPLSGDTVTTANWTSVLPGAGAVQADGSMRLDILSELGLDEDYTGYVQADADGLKLGAALLDAGGTRKTGVTYNGNILNLSDAGVVGDGGVAFALIDFTDFVANEVATGKERFYAGILDGTDLGAPLNNAEQSGTWSGMIALYNANAGGLLSAEFDLTVGFNNGADGTLTASLTHSDLADATFTLNGNFTSAGIIYGTTSFGYTGFLSTGSLTGLIGAKGAVGAFVSSGAGNRSTAGEARNRNGEYAGGFVVKASEPAVAVDCTTATGTPFAMGCDEELGIADVRTQLCLNDRTVANDTDNPTICGGLTMRFCFDTSANFGDNPFDGRCNTEMGIIATRLTLCENDEAHSTCGTIIANNCPPTGDAA